MAKITRYINEPILAMANVLGKWVKTDVIDFSFYFSSKNGNPHGNRAKVRFNPEKLSQGDFDGYMELHGAFKWIPNRQVSAKQINYARRFFQKYSILFDAVWNDALQESYLQDYFRKLMSWEELLAEFEVEDKELYNEIQQCRSLSDLDRLLS
jgi:hypothetical protein